MIMISVTSKDAESHIGKLADRLRNNQSLWNVIGQKLHSNIVRDHFNKEENRNGDKWPRWSKNGKTYSSRPWGRGGNQMLRDNGTMRNGIYFKSGGNSADIVSPVSYSKFHHTGTRHMPKREFMFIRKDEIGKLVSYMIRELFRGL